MGIHSHHRSIPTFSVLKLISIFAAFSHCSRVWSHHSKCGVALKSISQLNMSTFFCKKFTHYSNSSVKIAFRKVQFYAVIPSIVNLLPEISFLKDFKIQRVTLNLKITLFQNSQCMPSLHINMKPSRTSPMFINKKFHNELNTTLNPCAQMEVIEQDSITANDKKSFERIISEKIMQVDFLMSQRKNTQNYVKNYLQEKRFHSDFNIVDARNFDKIESEIKFTETINAQVESENEALLEKMRQLLQSDKKKSAPVEEHTQRLHNDFYNLLRLYVDKIQKSISEIQKYHQQATKTPSSEHLLNGLENNYKEVQRFLQCNCSQIQSSERHIQRPIEKIESFFPFFIENFQKHEQSGFTQKQPIQNYWTSSNALEKPIRAERYAQNDKPIIKNRSENQLNLTPFIITNGSQLNSPLSPHSQELNQSNRWNRPWIGSCREFSPREDDTHAQDRLAGRNNLYWAPDSNIIEQQKNIDFYLKRNQRRFIPQIDNQGNLKTVPFRNINRRPLNPTLSSPNLNDATCSICPKLFNCCQELSKKFFG